MPDHEPARASFRATVTGRVQGVGFRYAAVRRARAIGVCGTVANAWDGSVQVVAEGAPESLQAFLDWLREGPAGAHVRDVRVDWGPWTGSYRDFQVEL